MTLEEAKEYYAGNPVVKCLRNKSGKMVNSRTITQFGTNTVAKNYANQTIYLVEGFGPTAIKAKIIDIE